MTKPSAHSPKNVSHAAERAAAYTVAVMHYGVKVQQVSTEDSDDPDMWLPWAAFCLCSKCSASVSDENFTDVAVFAAEIMAMRPERKGEGNRWDAIDLHGLQVAEEVVCGSIGKLDPRHSLSVWFHERMSTPPTVQELREAKQEVMRLWEAAQAVVRSYRDVIDELADEIRYAGSLEHDNSPVLAEIAAKVRQPS